MSNGSRWETGADAATAFVRGRNAVVAALDAKFRGGNAPSYDRQLEDQFAVAHGMHEADGFIRDVLLHTSTREQLALALEHLIAEATLVHDGGYQITSTLNSVASAVAAAFASHPALSLRLAESQGTYELFPAGVPEIDSAVVDRTLAWLSGHPAVRSEAQKAARLLAEGDFSSSLNAARIAIEMLARTVLNNSKSLENQISGTSPLLSWLRSRGATAETVNLTNRMISSFCDLQNAWVKHPPATGSNLVRAEVEFGVYLAFTLKRLIIELSRN